MKIAVTGSSGLIGQALVPSLRAEGHDVVRFVRGTATGPDERSWDPSSQRLDQRQLADVDAVVHLAGAGVADRRWTPERKALILSSRVEGTTAVAQAVADADRTAVLLSASAVGFYGDTGDRHSDENSPSGKGFLADTVRRWEAATAPADAAGKRVVHLRSGIVLNAQGGALRQQLPIFRAGLGAPLGSGLQWVPWIALTDEIAAITHLLTVDVLGPANLVAPGQVTNREFTRTLGRVLRRPTLPVGVPGFVLTAGLGGFAREGLLTGQRLSPTVLDSSGFRFAHPELEGALRATLA